MSQNWQCSLTNNDTMKALFPCSHGSWTIRISGIRALLAGGRPVSVTLPCQCLAGAHLTGLCGQLLKIHLAVASSTDSCWSYKKILPERNLSPRFLIRRFVPSSSLDLQTSKSFQDRCRSIRRRDSTGTSGITVSARSLREHLKKFLRTTRSGDLIDVSNWRCSSIWRDVVTALCVNAVPAEQLIWCSGPKGSCRTPCDVCSRLKPESKRSSS